MPTKRRVPRRYRSGSGIDEFFGECAELIRGIGTLTRETKDLLDELDGTRKELEETRREIEGAQDDYPECFGQTEEGWGFDKDDEECENCPLADECEHETELERKKKDSGGFKRKAAKIEEPIVVDLERARELLEVSPDASEEEIRDAYVKLVKRVHPDRSKDPEATRKTQELNAAYELLAKDAIRRDAMR